MSVLRSQTLSLLAALSVSACSSPASDTPEARAKAGPTASALAPLPAPTYEVNGRLVTVRLPYRTRDNHMWVDADPNFSTGLFTFQMLDIEPRGGPDGTDQSVFTYKAEGAGSTKLRFALTPVGKGTPQDLIRQGQVAAWYEPEITVN